MNPDPTQSAAHRATHGTFSHGAGPGVTNLQRKVVSSKPNTAPPVVVVVVEAHSKGDRVCFFVSRQSKVCVFRSLSEGANLQSKGDR